MKPIAMASLVTLLVVAACGGDPDGGPAGAEFKALETVVANANSAMDDFVAATGKASNAEEFATAIRGLAKEWGPAGSRIKTLVGKIAILDPDQKRIDDVLNRLDPAIQRREKAIETGCEKWAETDVVQAAIAEYLEANQSWQ